MINFEQEDPIEAIKALTGGIGVDRAIDAVGVDASRPHHGPAAKTGKLQKKQFDREVEEVAPTTNPEGDNWHPGDAPSQALTWAITALAKAGTLSIIGVYPEVARFFEIGKAMNKNLTVKMGNCNHRKYIPKLMEMVQSGIVDPAKVLTKQGPLLAAIDAYKAFDERQPGWMKVLLEPQSQPARLAS
jgi:threonine dehydrogenase-like Zn-dependent dehydrogenase